MELFKLVCPACGADISLEKETRDCFCPYCGTKFKFDDGVQRSEHTVSYRDEARLRELELQEEARIREEKRIAKEAAIQRAQEHAARKSKRRSLFLKLFIGLLIIIAAWGVSENDSSGGNPGSSSPTPLVDADWYTHSAVVVPEVRLRARAEKEIKGPLQYSIPRTWTIGDTTVDGSESTYYPKTFTAKDTTVKIYITKINKDSDTWDTNTRNYVYDKTIRNITKDFILQSLNPMMIGNRAGVHAVAQQTKSYESPVHVFLVYGRNYYCVILYYGKYYEIDKHLDEVYYVTQSMQWDFSNEQDLLISEDIDSSMINDSYIKEYPGGFSSANSVIAYKAATPADSMIFDTSSDDNGLIGKMYYVEGVISEYTTRKIDGLDLNCFILSTDKGDVLFADIYSAVVKDRNDNPDAYKDFEDANGKIEEKNSDYTFPGVGQKAKIYGVYVGVDPINNIPALYYGFPDFILTMAKWD